MATQSHVISVSCWETNFYFQRQNRLVKGVISPIKEQFKSLGERRALLKKSI